MLAAAGLARAPRVAGLQLGEAALAAEIGIEPSAGERELLWIRSMVVVARSAAGIAAPVAGACAGGADLRTSTERLRRMGFGGRACAGEHQAAGVGEIFANA
ncbi:hypothetical protein GCM10007977_013770 [Dactylosporangium sucinum]|uniref:HpcH/HpaI aldolase/citrate lyase domain-containing protein n=1 Tax=Dactylosporangium sucinum TaxID=1424081 RepID=A0A917T8V3_9ACTN|nr:hypothetical protein GCM10007977_013770 [Dactylosporangium sucinum]